MTFLCFEFICLFAIFATFAVFLHTQIHIRELDCILYAWFDWVDIRPYCIEEGSRQRDVHQEASNGEQVDLEKYIGLPFRGILSLLSTVIFFVKNLFGSFRGNRAFSS